MKLLFLISCIAISATGAIPWLEVQESKKLTYKPHPSIELDEAWSAFKDTHGKLYSSNDDESQRKEIFGENLKKIQIHNYLHSKGLKTYTMGINQFADMTTAEFSKMMNGYQKPLNRTEGITYLSPNLDLEIPSAVDWRTKGYVTPVKNQGQCGSCWAFSTTGSLEGQHFRSTGKLVSLSEQNLVDCSRAYQNEGCNGGLMDNAFKYIKENGGLDTEASYPYVAKDMKCHFTKKNIGATDKGFVDVTPGDENKLKEAVATVGPVSIAIDANHASFQMYHSGIYNEPECTDELDHGVLIVGYGTKNNEDYWIVKNSWGVQWGDQGYIYMSRNKNNQCGVASAASYPLV